MNSFQNNITYDYFVNTTIEFLNTTTTSSSIAPPPYLTWKQLMFVIIGALLVGLHFSLNIITKEWAKFM